MATTTGQGALDDIPLRIVGHAVERELTYFEVAHNRAPSSVREQGFPVEL